MGILTNWVGRKVAPVDIDSTKARVTKAKAEGLGAHDVAQRLTEAHARRSALRGFVTGLPGGLLSLPLLFVDVRGVWSERASLAAGIHYANDPRFFDDPAWWRTVWMTTSKVVPDNAARGLMTFAVKEMVFRRTGKMVVRGLSTKVVPVVGGIAGAAWNYVWIKREGARMRVDILTDELDVGEARHTEAKSLEM